MNADRNQTVRAIAPRPNKNEQVGEMLIKQKEAEAGSAKNNRPEILDPTQPT
jgi:hypothetical protein